MDNITNGRVFRLCAALLCAGCVGVGVCAAARSVMSARPVWTYAHVETALSAPALPAASSQMIDLNAADEDALKTLPGIGPVIAGRIIDYRDTAGGFMDTSELIRVYGIGDKTLNALLPYVYVIPIE